MHKGEQGHVQVRQCAQFSPGPVTLSEAKGLCWAITSSQRNHVPDLAGLGLVVEWCPAPGGAACSWRKEVDCKGVSS